MKETIDRLERHKPEYNRFLFNLSVESPDLLEQRFQKILYLMNIVILIQLDGWMENTLQWSVKPLTGKFVFIFMEIPVGDIQRYKSNIVEVSFYITYGIHQAVI